MSQLLNESILSKKTEMYAMIISIEADFVENFGAKLELSDIPQESIARSNKVGNETDPLFKVLKGLDIQAYIEICNSNIIKLSINAAEKAFLNVDLHKIIPIRNAVMHPRPLGIYDYPMLKTVFSEIDNKLPCFSWHHVEKTRVQIAHHPETLLPPPLLKKNDRIIENLPLLVDYEETSFIGRRQEIGEIRAQLNRKNVHILSIIGDGGVGKTAIALKLLYDMLDDPKTEYELIIWVSLKTNELSDHDFVDIKKAITSVSAMYEQLLPFVGADTIGDTKEYIIDLAKNFKTLFVLDNLETLNTREIREFIDDFSEYGKVLITSRIGLGEMEHRYRLKGLNDTDVIEYADVLLSLYGFECYFTDERKRCIFCDELHANPLAIKWFVRCLYNGQTEEDILANKEDLVNFCMANVYDKLSSYARKVLDLLAVAGVPLSFPELVYYLNEGLHTSVQLRYAINELGKCNFINEDEFRTHNQIVVTEFACDFLSPRLGDAKTQLVRFRELEQRISAFKQELLSNQVAAPFRPKSMLFTNNGELIVLYFLAKALREYRAKQISSPLEIINHTQEILPQFFECNIALAHVYDATSPLKAKEEYANALKYARQPNEKLRVSLLYADFLIRTSDYLTAIDFLSALQDEYKDCIDIRLEKAKALSCVYQFDDALHELNSLEQHPQYNRYSTRIISKRADIFRRKGNRIDVRKTQEKLADYTTAISCLEHCPLEEIVVDQLVEVLTAVAYLYTDEIAMTFLCQKVRQYVNVIRSSRNFKAFRNTIKDIRERKDSELLKQISSFTINIHEHVNSLNNNEALIYAIKDGYGFSKTAEQTGIYFSMAGLPTDIAVGDILAFTAILESKNGPQLIGPKKDGSIYERI